MLQHVQHGLPVSAGIDDDDRFVVQAKLLPGDDLERLVQGAEPAGQDDEGVRAVEHHALAGVHAVDDMQLGQAGMLDLKLLDVVGNDADHLAAGGQGRVGGDAHQADPAAAIHQLESAFANFTTDSPSRVLMALVDAVGGTAINANRPHVCHYFSWWI